ncbi:MAG: shikimate dehydrogenase [Micavibrio sp.]|nr:shikimate dehydrogenase [Micavibrio sp.]
MTQNTKAKAAVIGQPVGHSKSPLIHNYWIEKHGIDASYEAIDIAPENLEKELIRLVDEGYFGFNVTRPHKEKVFAVCDSLDELAQAVGAVNTVTIKNGKMNGTNTDVFGFTENIKATRPAFDFKAGPAVVLGAGGAARAVIYALLKEGVPEVRVVNRTKNKAQTLARDFKRLRVHDWEKRSEVFAESNLLVNTTSMGQSGQPKLELDLTALPKNAVVNDIVYAPLMTDLLRDCEDRGNQIVTGIGMLLHQARPAFEAWFGVLPDVDAELEKRVLA